jgi:hypothetical protein
MGAAVLLAVLILAALASRRTWRGALAVLAAGGVNLWMMLYLVPQYSPRYLVMFSLAVWLVAGVGLHNLLLHLPVPPGRWNRGGAVVMAVMGVAVFTVFVLVPFKTTGGSTAEYDLVNFQENAASLVDERGLIDCVRGLGPVSSENPHVYNRILYASHRYEDIKVLPEEKMKSTKWMAHYREEGEGVLEGEACPGLRHFKVLPFSPPPLPSP